MDRNEIIEIVNKFLIDEFEVEEDKIIPESNLRDTLELDSLDYVDLVVVIEQNFGFKVVAEDFQSIITFEDFYNYCYNKAAEKQASWLAPAYDSTMGGQVQRTSAGLQNFLTNTALHQP